MKFLEFLATFVLIKLKQKNKHRIERIKFTFNTNKRIYTQTKTSKQG